MASPDSDRFVIRPLEAGDFQKGHLTLLSQLSEIGDGEEGVWQERFKQLSSQPDVYHVRVIEDTQAGKIVGSGTLFVELKFLRNGGKCGHIEDIVVDGACRGHGLGLKLIEALLGIGKAAGCYKVILDCKLSNAPFYAKAGMYPKETQMVKYF